MITKPELQKLERDLNKMLLSVLAFRNLLPKTPNMLYFQAKKDCYAFCWTTEPCLEKGKKRFYACVYRVLKDGSWKLKRKVGFAKRKVAKARALKWYEERKLTLHKEEKTTEIE
jgi:hypothetical protein